MKKRYLVLENGRIFEGEAFGADVSSVGELVFSTAMCGYIETLTDPVYYGQIVMQTFPVIGNYGMIESDLSGPCSVKGYVVREMCVAPSNFRAEYSLGEYLYNNGVPGICGIDTRELTKIIRKSGVMNAYICDTLPSDFSVVKKYSVKDAVKNVVVNETVVYPAVGEKKYRVVLVDFGAKKELVRHLCECGCEVISVPYCVTDKEILDFAPDGVVLSDGPGDPTENINSIDLVSKLVGELPIFGVGLGHLLVFLALGGKTAKHKYGHHGANQPVKDTEGTRTYITNQNHCFIALPETIKTGKVSYININDGTCEGMDYSDKKAFTVQFLPEISESPNDMSFLYKKFCNMMGGAR